jgi:hypothetical protein
MSRAKQQRPQREAGQSSPQEEGGFDPAATKKQKQIIHILKHQLIDKGLLDEEGYHQMLMKSFGKKSSRNLTREEASFLIGRLVKMGGVITHDGHAQLISSRRFEEESSIEGLRHEVIQLARERYGNDFERPLVALCKKLHIDDYKRMDVRHAKAIKETLLRLETEGPYEVKRKKAE